MSKTKNLSRADIETACILLAVGEQGCATHDIPERLGLSPSMLAPVRLALTSVASSSLLVEINDNWTLTEQGKTRLKELGVLKKSRARSSRQATNPA